MQSVERCWPLLLAALVLGGCGDRSGMDAGPGADAGAAGARATAGAPPNILLVVADDLGYSDLGAYGGEIATPNLDALAREGVVFTQFYAAPTCSPTRAMLLSGMDSHRAGLGSMAEAIAMTPHQQGQPGYEGYLNERVAALPELLHAAGYHTYMAGKWHLGLEPEQGPSARGFERAFALLQSGGGHFDHLGLFPNDPARYRDDGREVQLPADFYSTRFYSDRIIEYIEAGRGDGRPWFAYLAYTAPHWPLQAPRASIDKYAGRYAAGYDALHAERLERMIALGLVPDDVEPYPGAAQRRPWSELDEAERRVEARRMAIYAAMVDDLDTHLGRVLAYLEASGQRENTFILFLSDNGPEGHDDRLMPMIRPWMEQCCDLSYENMGAADSYVFQGPEWARVSAAPFNRFKHFTHEGGIRVPAIAHFPSRFDGGRLHREVVTVRDVMPALLELAGVEPPEGEFEGREVLAMQGRSLLAVLDGRAASLYDEGDAIGWELFGRRALRRGDFKLVWAEPPHGSGGWQLFNVARDPGELHDLSAVEPVRVGVMQALWEYYVSSNGVLPGMSLQAALRRTQARGGSPTTTGEVRPPGQ